MKDSFNKLYDKIESWVDSFIIMLPNLAVALAILILSVFVARLLKKVFLKLLKRFSNNTAVNNLLSNILTVIIVTVGLFISLGILNLDKTVTSLLAGAGVVGLAVGLAFQEPILNILSGIMMSVREPFNIGDIVKSNGYFGNITQITLRSTTIKKFSGEDVIIPNKLVIQNPIENYSLTKYRRVDIDCGVSYNDDLEKAEEIALTAIKENIDHDKNKPVELVYTDFGDSSINFTLRFWLDSDNQLNYLKRKSEAIKAVKKAFDSNDISIPFPIRTVEFSQKQEIKDLINTTGSDE